MDFGNKKVIEEHKTVIDLGGSLTWLACILLSILIIHFSCAAGTATGYVEQICTRGLNVWDALGMICCAPIYLLIIILLSGGLRIW